MFSSSVQNMYTVYALFYGFNTVTYFRKHSATDKTVLDHFMCFIQCQHGNQCRWIVRIFANTFDVSHKYQFLRFHGFCNCAGSIVRIDIVRLIIIPKSDWRNDRHKIIFQKSVDQFGIDFFHISDVTDIFAVCCLFITAKSTAVFSADAGCSHTKFFHHLYQMLIYFI